MNKLLNIFNKTNNIIIGAIHLPSLSGYEDFPGMKVAIENMKRDLKAFEEGGVDAVILENNYDIPHKEKVDSDVSNCIAAAAKELKEMTKLPIGLSILWNDFESALSIAKSLDLQFIRIPVFIDDVETDYGRIIGNPNGVANTRKKLGAENIAILTDIHVKHAKILSSHTFLESASLAIEHNSDALIITGKWTGDSPDINELEGLRQHVGNFPILVGSGANSENIKLLMKYANGTIVSTSLKGGTSKKTEVNVKGYEQRIEKERVREFTSKLNLGT